MKEYKAIGLMSGTSMDGLDIVYCYLSPDLKNLGIWRYKILYAETVRYTNKWKRKLSSAFSRNRKEIIETDIEYGKFIAIKVNTFIRKYNIKPDFIASHGHTIFHQPEKKYTLQIGNGKILASVCRLPVVCDFRIGDVKLGGQGAPLVPIADKLLFSEYDFCLNLGGIANISYDENGKRIAYDICPVNIALNSLANQLGKDFDKDGKIARKGNLHLPLFKALNSLEYYTMKPPKSLGREWIEKFFFPVLNSFAVSVEDKMKTTVVHIAEQIASVTNSQLSEKAFWGNNTLQLRSGISNLKILITGGGAYNKELIKHLKHRLKIKMVLPDNTTIQFKEALAFALLGALRIRNEVNILKSVTGAKKDSSGGKIYRV